MMYILFTHLGTLFHIYNNIYFPLLKLVWAHALVWPYDLAHYPSPSSLPPSHMYLIREGVGEELK
jgi:hypothetical protein